MPVPLAASLASKLDRAAQAAANDQAPCGQGARVGCEARLTRHILAIGGRPTVAPPWMVVVMRLTRR